MFSEKLGPASTEEDRLPTYPVIRVQFPQKQMNISFAPWQKNMRDPNLFESFSSVKKYESAIYWKQSGLYILPLYVKGKHSLNKLAL